MTRILIFSVAYEPLTGGAELAVRNITDRLFDFEFDLITCRFDRRHKPREKIGNVNVYRIGFGSRIGRLLFPVLAFRLARKLQQERDYKIMWSIMAAYAGAASLLFVRHFPRVKLLLTLQEGDPVEHIHGRVRGYKKQWQAVFRRADYIQAISKFLAEWARAEGATCPVTVVPNGVDISKFKIEKSKIKITNQNAKYTIITVSRLVPKNGVDILIRALAVILRGTSAFPSLRGNPKQSPSYDHEIASPPEYGRLAMTEVVKLLILGTGPEETNLEKLCAELKISDRVDFLGNISQEELPKYLAGVDIFVRPSRSEGLGTAFLEAMAAGLPVVGTAVGGIPDFLRDGETGIFCKVDDPVDLANKIELLMEDVKLRSRLSENGGKLMAEKYSWDKISERMEKIFILLSSRNN